MFIRQALPGDASRLAEILVFTKRCAYRDIFRDDDGSFNGLRVLDIALDLRDRPGALDGLWVWDDGIVKGLVRFAARGRETEICELYVDQFFRREGIGGQLLEFALQDSRAARLWVLEKNASGRAFYEKHGFSDSGERKIEPGTSQMLALYRR